MIAALLAIFGLWCFWALYILVMGIYRAHLAGSLGPVTKVLALPWVALGLLTDVAAQYTAATVYFWDWPAKQEHLVTTRLKRYSAGTGWRKRHADWVCKHLLDPFDPHNNHC